MARPKKSAEEARTEVTQCRLTVAEREEVRSAAYAAGISGAEYMRRRLLGVPLPSSSRNRTDPMLVASLNRVGNNVNQLARAVHSDRSFQQYWKEIGEELREVLQATLAGITE